MEKKVPTTKFDTRKNNKKGDTLQGNHSKRHNLASKGTKKSNQNIKRFKKQKVIKMRRWRTMLGCGV